MSRFVSNRLAKALQRRTEAYAYGDKALLLVDVGSGTYDSYNNEIVTISEVPIDCSFTDKTSSERWSEKMEIEQIDAEIRFSRPVPSKGNRVKVIGRFGGTFHEQTYEIVGIQDRGPFGFVCGLRKVTV